MGAAPVIYETAELRRNFSIPELTEIINQRRRNARKLLWEASADEARALMEPILSLAEIINQRRRDARTLLREARVDKAHRLTARILSLIEKHFGISVSTIIGPCREAHLVMVRAIAIWLIRQELGLSYPAMGAIFKRNHTTIRHHYERMAKRAAYPDFRRRLEGLQQELKDG